MNQWFRRFLPSVCCIFLTLVPYSLAQQPAAPATHAALVPSEVAQMQTIEDQWSGAIDKRDQYSLENVLAPTFVDISAQGEVTTRNQQIARMFLKEVAAQKLEQKVVTVRLFGDVALVTGTYSLRKHDTAGTLNEKGVFTHMYQRTTRSWWCVQSQRTAVVEQEVPKNKQKKPSPAEEPFHIPGIYKGAPAAAPQATQPPAQQTPAPQTGTSQDQPK